MKPLYRRLPPLQALAFFEAAARHNSFTKAAEELCVSQSAVSKQIKHLEEFLSTELFLRGPQGLEISEDGKELYLEAQAALEKLSAVSSRIQNTNRTHELTIVATVAVAHYWLFPRVALFKTQFSDININIYSSDQIDETMCLQHDLGILYGDGDWDAPLNSHYLFDEKIYAVCGPTYPFETCQEPEQLLGQELIHLGPSKWRWTCWSDWFKGFGIDYEIPSGSMLFNNLPLVLQAAGNNMGIALGWEFAVQDQLANGTLRLACEKPLVPNHADYLVYNNQRPLNPAAECFRDWLLAEAAGEIDLAVT
ncbi:LysR substrate-binding domain-containing protein [Pontibacterium granulatum]|uniref:LysR substrate-binding domain-containing protein n=1 Tax=Pontibacterium granulatum TaxID=2036029 RepID=UPI00249BFDBA|nr:LysR substrate-binding domain-containing protein [Pontibacterium granulatum]MDI3325773.1 LysR substrate-binding domain-containing protein [Pontibacterium granulatum]